MNEVALIFVRHFKYFGILDARHMKNKVVAALLAFVGGFLGLHKFYLRDSGAGIFYIFLTVMTSSFFPISAILGFIDGLRYLMMPPEEFDRKFNKRYKRQKPTRKKNSRVERYESRKTKNRGGGRVRSNPFKKSGLKKYKDYDIEEAIEDFHKALKIDPKDISIHFNLACAYSLMEDKEKAFKHLELAVAKGLKDTGRIMNHDDLAFLRIQPEFQDFKVNGFKLIRRVQNNPERGEKPMDDILLAQLNRLMELRKKGVLTEQEFLRERKKVLLR